MNYGFLIDNRVCIGCHACSTACKQENEVPLGVNRTWVKTVEKGAFPDTRRHFQVTRCNHCANPPCVRICPVSAMFQRADGIVDFDPRVCIGCKACLQACPYDAIYVDPDEGTAAKCHYCAHRVEVGLEPACVVVCPEHAIIAGDLDDPTSEISRMVARHPVSVRKPEQGTAPKLFYIDGEQAALTPTAAQMVGGFAFADVASDQALAMHARPAPTAPRTPMPVHQPSGATIRTPTTQAVGTWTGPLYVGQRVAEQMVQTTYNAQHKVPWHWPVPAYLVTKAIGAGLPLVMALWICFVGPVQPMFMAIMSFVAIVFIGLTTALLVLDLERPERFLLILTRPQWRSWLTRGAYILIAHTLVLLTWLAAALAFKLAMDDWNGDDTESIMAWLGQVFEVSSRSTSLPSWLIILGLISSVLAATYTAFLFAQAEGRDLWQSPLLPVHLVIQAAVAGTAVLLIGSLFDLPYVGATKIELMVFPDRHWPPDAGDRLLILLIGLLVVDLAMTLWAEFGVPHASEAAASAAHDIKYGRYRRWYWWGAVGLGHVVPVGLLLLVMAGLPDQAALSTTAAVSAAILTLVGLYAYEYAFVMAPQEVPNS